MDPSGHKSKDLQEKINQYYVDMRDSADPVAFELAEMERKLKHAEIVMKLMEFLPPISLSVLGITGVSYVDVNLERKLEEAEQREEAMLHFYMEHKKVVDTIGTVAVGVLAVTGVGLAIGGLAGGAAGALGGSTMMQGSAAVVGTDAVVAMEVAAGVTGAVAVGMSGRYSGTGQYKDVRGHHVHAKSGFKGNIKYDPDKGFSISQEFMEESGLNHQSMTSKQRELFKELYESGRPNTLEEHTWIAREALKAGGADDSMIDDLINASLKNLQEQGATAPSRILWYSRETLINCYYS